MAALPAEKDPSSSTSASPSAVGTWTSPTRPPPTAPSSSAASNGTAGSPTPLQRPSHALARWSPQRTTATDNAGSTGWGAGAARTGTRPPVPARSATISVHALPRDLHASLPVVSPRQATPLPPTARPLPTAPASPTTATTTSSPAHNPPPVPIHPEKTDRDVVPKVPPRTRPQPSRSPSPPALAALHSSVSPVTTSSSSAESPVPTEGDAIAASQQPKRVPPPRPSRVTVTAGRIDGWMREQPAEQPPPIKVPPIPAKPIDDRDRDAQAKTSPVSPSHRRSPSSGHTPGLLRANSPSIAAPPSSFTPPPSSFSYVASPLRTASPRGEQTHEETLSPDPKGESGATLRDRKGSFSTALFSNLNFWKKSSPSSARSEVIRRGESNRFLDAINKSKEDSDVAEPASSTSSPSTSKRDDQSSLRAIQGFLFSRDDKKKSFREPKDSREKEASPTKDQEAKNSKEMTPIADGSRVEEPASVDTEKMTQHPIPRLVLPVEQKGSGVLSSSVSSRQASPAVPRTLGQCGRSTSWTSPSRRAVSMISPTTPASRGSTQHPSIKRTRSAILPRSAPSLLASSKATPSTVSTTARLSGSSAASPRTNSSSRSSADSDVNVAASSSTQTVKQSGPLPINHIIAANKYLCQRWAQGKCKPGRAPRIKKLKSSERKRPVVLALDSDGILVLDPHSHEIILSHPFTQIKNWGHREGAKGMHFNYIAVGSKYPEIFDFRSDQAHEIFERITFLHALKAKNTKIDPMLALRSMDNLAAHTSADERTIKAQVEIRESPNTLKPSDNLDQVSADEKQDEQKKRLSSEATTTETTETETVKNDDTKRGRVGVRRLDKIRWSVMMEEPVELVDVDNEHRAKNDEDEEPEKSAQQLLSPRSMMARLEKKKSWQDITKNIKKFDFQSEKAKEVREERERREKEKEREKDLKKKDRSDDSSASLIKAAKKSLRVKTLRKEEIEIVRRVGPGEEPEQEDRSPVFSRNVSFEALAGDVGRQEVRKNELLLSGDVDALDQSSGERKKVDQREELVKELIKTENKYVRDLNTIVEQYMKRLRDNGMMEPSDIAIIFSNVDQIKVLNSSLLDSLSGLEELTTENSNVGERFLSFIGYLRLYTQYCSNQTLAGNRLKELKEAKPELHQLLEEMRDLPDVNRLDLESFLIKPMQRLTRYPLFFQQLLKLTPDTHPDYPNLAKCLEGLHEVVTTINNQKQRNDNLNKLLLLQQQFIDTKEQPALKLVEASRKFVREGVFPKIIYGSVSIKNCTVLLFNDILVLAVKKDKGVTAIYTPKSPKIPLTGLLVWDEKSVPFGFSVVGREAGQDKITIQANSEEEKAAWVDEFSIAIAHMPSVLRGHRRSPSAVEKFIRHNEPPASPLG